LQKTNIISKENLLKEFSSLGGNYKNIDKAEKLKKDIEKYHKEDGKEDIQLLDILKILKAYEAENQKVDFKEIYKLVLPVFNRLMNLPVTSWDIGDIRISQLVLMWVQSFEEAEKLCSLTLAALNKYVDEVPTVRISFFIHINMLSRILKAKFLEIDHLKEPKRLNNAKSLFKAHLNNVLSISERKGDELKKFETFALLRAGIFDEDSEFLTQNLELLEKMKDRPLYNVAKDEVRRYRPSKGINLTKRHFGILIGSSVKTIRESLNFEAEDFAEKLDISKSHLILFESGERSFPTYRMLELAYILDTPLDELLYGKNEGNTTINEKSNIFQKIKFITSNFNESDLTMVYDFINFLQSCKSKAVNSSEPPKLEENSIPLVVNQ